MDASHTRPTVSIVLPTLNERDYIYDCICSLAGQDYPTVSEILVIDGGSSDGTREIAERWGGKVRLIDNPRVTAAAAMNIGIQAATGDYVVRADAHTLYAPDYVSRCITNHRSRAVDNVGGVMRPVGTTRFGRAVAAVTQSRFGVGPGAFHYTNTPQEADTVYLGSWRRKTLVDLGGYDESALQWAAEDQECNLRLRQRGGIIWIDPQIKSWYFPRETARALWRQYGNYGVAKASTLAKHRTLPSYRPLVPSAFVGASVALFVIGRGPLRCAVPAFHAIIAASVARKLARQPGVRFDDAFAAIMICHWSYGVGFWRGISRILRGRGFDTRPHGHR